MTGDGERRAPCAIAGRFGLLLLHRLLWLLLLAFALEMPHVCHDLVDGAHADQVEVVHADQVQHQVPVEALLHNLAAELLNKLHARVVHLIVRNVTESRKRKKVNC